MEGDPGAKPRCRERMAMAQCLPSSDPGPGVRRDRRSGVIPRRPVSRHLSGDDRWDAEGSTRPAGLLAPVAEALPGGFVHPRRAATRMAPAEASSTKPHTSVAKATPAQGAAKESWNLNSPTVSARINPRALPAM